MKNKENFMIDPKGISFSVSKNLSPVPEQPAIRRGNQGVQPKRIPPNFINGSNRSIERLKQLGFDPIERLVIRHRELTAELEHQKSLRSGAVVELRQDGKAKAFVFDNLLGCHDRLTAIERELLRYGYGRVPEVAEPEKQKVPALTINLTKKGETYIVNSDEFGTDSDD